MIFPALSRPNEPEIGSVLWAIGAQETSLLGAWGSHGALPAIFPKYLFPIGSGYLPPGHPYYHQWVPLLPELFGTVVIMAVLSRAGWLAHGPGSVLKETVWGNTSMSRECRRNTGRQICRLVEVPGDTR